MVLDCQAIPEPVAPVIDSTYADIDESESEEGKVPNDWLYV